MDNRSLGLKFYYVTFLSLLGIIIIPPQSTAQNNSSYELLPAPDVWYNSVDGIRVGLRLRGQMSGTFGDGPHRMNAGIWLGTKFPANPVSYYFKFTEPIPSISDFGNEGSISLESSIRTGFQSHGLIFDKRWQNGFDEKNYKELSVGVRGEERFNLDYLLYQQLWQTNWLYLANVTVDITNTNGLGRYFLSFSGDANIAGNHDSFLRGDINFRQQVKLSRYFSLSSRFYTGLASDNTSPEYLFSHSFKSPRFWMDSGLTRARGTIPPNWLELGNIQVAGGAGLRGYLSENIEALNNQGIPLYTSLSALNLEFNYPNPLDNAINNIPVIGGLAELRSYLFFDSGTSLGISGLEESRTLSDAGAGFQLLFNIPDYLGKSRGLVLRYDMPLWLSHPGSDNAFEFRNVIGIGATISL